MDNSQQSTVNFQVLDEIKGITFHGGTTSAVAGFTLGLEEINKHRRKDARLVFVLISDGNSQDRWDVTQATAKKVPLLFSYTTCPLIH